MTRYDDMLEQVDEIIREGDKHGATGHTKISSPVEVGALVHGEFLSRLAYGRSLGLNIDYQRFGGWVTKYGFLHVEGPWAKMRTFLLSMSELGPTP